MARGSTSTTPFFRGLSHIPALLLLAASEGYSTGDWCLYVVKLFFQIATRPTVFLQFSHVLYANMQKTVEQIFDILLLKFFGEFLQF